MVVLELVVLGLLWLWLWLQLWLMLLLLVRAQARVSTEEGGGVSSKGGQQATPLRD